MDKLKQQTILLVTLMAFLSIVTVFILETTPPDTTSTQQNIEENKTLTDHVGKVEIKEPEGDNLIAQSARGLIALYHDVQSGTALFLESDEEYEDEE